MVYQVQSMRLYHKKIVEQQIGHVAVRVVWNNRDNHVSPHEAAMAFLE